MTLGASGVSTSFADTEPITDIDTSAAEAFDQLLDDLEVESVQLVLA